jgi:aminopeptidase N
MSLFRPFLSVVIVALFPLLLGSCSSQQKAPEKTEETSPLPNLTKEEAEHRFGQVKDIKYKLTFNLDPKQDTYTGTVVIAFESLKPSEALRIDFFDGQVKNFEVNGQTTPFQYNGKYISMAGDILNKGQNKITIDFISKFRNEGKGLTKFEDPEDKNVYLHSQFEPYDANRAFPCFDQPDLKATYESEVTAPRTWTIVSSTREEKVTEKGEFRIWKFPESAKFSTYVYSLHAGPFKIWEKNFRIPLRLMVRQSLAKYVKTEEWFDPTQKSFDFYEKYFGYPYPFKKYDQVIVPEFAAGAMENVAAVTFNEHFISRGVKSIQEKRNLADVIAHEMAHMWFGDLVTMKWWNDLWLNESFATYMSHLALAENTQYKEAWRDFYGGKIYAYWEDDLVTTHPIEAKIPDVLSAMTSFDGITYNKGSAVIKQLHYFLTPEKFQKGIQIYFKKFANQNTRLNDFLGALSAGSGVDLEMVKHSWLQTAGVNRITTDLVCKDGKITKLDLVQTASKDYPEIRPHKALVALLYPQESQLNVTKSMPVFITGERTSMKELNGQACPSIVYPNYEDHAYFLVNLDPISLENFKTDPLAVRDPFLRQMLWKGLWDMVRDAKISVNDYVTVVTQNGLNKENDAFNLKALIGSVVGRGQNSASVLYYLSRGDKKLFMETARKIEELIWQRLMTATPGSEQQKFLLGGFIGAVRTDFGNSKLIGFLNGSIKLKELPIDQDRRWEMIEILARSNHPDAKKLIANEEKKDKSYFGKQGALESKVSLPNWDEKKKWLDEFKKKESASSASLLYAAADGIFPWTQENLRENYSSQFFNDLTLVNKTREGHLAGTFVSFAPIDCGHGTDRISPYLDEHGKELQPQVLKSLKVMRQENERCQRVVEKIK